MGRPASRLRARGPVLRTRSRLRAETLRRGGRGTPGSGGGIAHVPPADAGIARLRGRAESGRRTRRNGWTPACGAARIRATDILPYGGSLEDLKIDTGAIVPLTFV